MLYAIANQARELLSFIDPAGPTPIWRDPSVFPASIQLYPTAVDAEDAVNSIKTTYNIDLRPWFLVRVDVSFALPK